MKSPATEKGHHPGSEPANKGKAYPTEVPAPDEVRSLIEGCSNRAPTGIRNRALLVAMYRGGLRVGDALALRPKDVDAAMGTVTVLPGKGDRRRVVGLSPGAMVILSRWIEATPDLQSAHQCEKTREAAGLTEKELGALVDVSELSIRTWESGWEEPRGLAQMAYARVLAKLAARSADER